MTVKSARTGGVLVGMYVSKLPLDLKRAVELEVLRRKHAGDESATQSSLVTEALEQWRRGLIEQGRHEVTDSISAK